MALRPSNVLFKRLPPLRARIRALESQPASQSLLPNFNLQFGEPSSSSSSILSSSEPSSSSSTSSASSSAAGPASVPWTSGQDVDAVGPVGSMMAKRYYIKKPASGDFPVYTKKRNNGDCSTIIKGVQGDVEAFQRDLNSYFKKVHIDPLTDAPKAVIRPNTQHLTLKGRMVGDVKDWMEGQNL